MLGVPPGTGDGLSSVKDLSCGTTSGCAVDTSGGVKCCGDDIYAQLGNQHLGGSGSGAPVSVPGLAGPVNSVAVGNGNLCVVLKNASVQCCGRSIGDLSSSATLTAHDGLVGAVRLAYDSA